MTVAAMSCKLKLLKAVTADANLDVSKLCVAVTFNVGLIRHRDNTCEWPGRDKMLYKALPVVFARVCAKVCAPVHNDCSLVCRKITENKVRVRSSGSWS